MAQVNFDHRPFALFSDTAPHKPRYAAKHAPRTDPARRVFRSEVAARHPARRSGSVGSWDVLAK